MVKKIIDPYLNSIKENLNEEFEYNFKNTKIHLSLLLDSIVLFEKSTC